MKFLIVGLGNIGEKYSRTRHNIGFDVVDSLAKEFEVPFTVERLAYKAEFKYKGRQIHLIKPTTYMNLSGQAVKYWLNNLKIDIPNLLVVVDDIALPFGTLRMRGKGSHAGHNGLKDIEAQLESNQYARLKFGIGDSFSRGKQIDYVLGKWSMTEEIDLSNFIENSKKIILSYSTIGLDQTMSLYNNK